MSTNKTQNYNLHAWALEDDFLTGEMNENFAALDAALKAEATAADQALQTEAAARAQQVAALSDVVTQKEAALNSTINQKVSALNASISQLSSGKAEFVTGVYTGDGAEQRDIYLGFSPKAVLLMDRQGNMGGYSKYGGLAVQGGPIYYEQPIEAVLTLTATGFRVYYAKFSSSHYSCSNYNRAILHYLALR